MRRKTALLTLLVAVVALTLGGELRESRNASALIPLPLLPFDPHNSQALTTTQLGAEFDTFNDFGAPPGVLSGEVSEFATGVVESTGNPLEQPAATILQSTEETTQLLRPGGNASEGNASLEEDLGAAEDPLPTSIDWRSKDGQNWITPVKDQGYCDACWAFASVGLVEAMYNIRQSILNPPRDFSEEYLTSDCHWGVFAFQNCRGGKIGPALSFIKSEGIPDEGCMSYGDQSCWGYLGFFCAPYPACVYGVLPECSNATCNSDYLCGDWKNRLKRIESAGSLSSHPLNKSPNHRYIGIDGVKRYLVEQGPLASAMCTDNCKSTTDATGYTTCSRKWGLVDHAVVIVGYDDSVGKGWWIVKDSYGTKVNKDGYMFVPYGQCKLGVSNYYADVSATPGRKRNPSFTGDIDHDGIDDATALYPRWLLTTPSEWDREVRLSVPPYPATGDSNDTTYSQRLVTLQCFWLDANGAPDANGDGWISSAESMADPDVPPGIDDDGDCLADAAYAQPGQPVDENDSPTGWTCPPLVYNGGSGPLQVQHDRAADEDCDGLVDGIEVAWGSNPAVADTDGDGATDFVEMYRGTDPLNPDTDGDGIRDRPEDDYIAAAAGAAESGESVNADDNCPTVSNPDQANNDGQRRVNGAQIPGSWASNPNQDKMGDACDLDDDNDGLEDGAEPAAGTDLLAPDTDGDGCVDGADWQLADPADPATKCPTTLTVTELTERGACDVGLPDGAYYPEWEGEYDSVEDDVEMDIDGDGVLCRSGSTILDSDSDNGTGTGSVAPVEITDALEAYGYGTSITDKDTDGDGCQDWIEIVDINGNRLADILDVLYIAKRAFGITPVSDSDPVLDIDKNGNVTILDALVAAKNSSLVKSHYPCASEG